MGTLIYLIDTIFKIYYLVLFARVIISWIGPNIHDPNWRKVLKYIYNLTEPVLGPIRRLLPTTNIGIDFSPLIAFIALTIIRNFLIRLLISISVDFGL